MELKVEDLRLGNYINYLGFLVKVEDISTESIGVYSNTIDLDIKFGDIYIDCQIKDLKPIPLDEEWLLKLGFEVEQSGEFTLASNEVNDKFYIYSSNKSDSWKLDNYKGGFRHITSVNQLQNLYHSLTGKELVIGD